MPDLIEICFVVLAEKIFKCHNCILKSIWLLSLKLEKGVAPHWNRLDFLSSSDALTVSSMVDYTSVVLVKMKK